MADEKSLSGRILAILWYICASYKCNFSAITYFQKSAVTIYVPYAYAPASSAAFVIGARARALAQVEDAVMYVRGMQHKSKKIYGILFCNAY